jgi:hypothetical protein
VRPTLRVLVTGSRNWPDPDLVYHKLDQLHRRADLVIVHGACPTGADAYAAIWCHLNPDGVTEVRRPADWERHGKAAGPLRNAQMVADGADLCLAFRIGASRGTSDTIDRAKAAGIPVQLHEFDQSRAERR